MSAFKRIASQKIALLLCFLLVGAGVSRAQTVIKLKSTLDGAKGQMAKDSAMTVMDSLYFDAGKITSLDTPYKVRNIVTFKINEYAGVQLPASFTATATIRIIYTRPDYQKDSMDKVLTINYVDTSSYTSRSSFVFNNAHQVTIRVLGVSTNSGTDIKPVLQIDNEMQVTPVYKLSCTNDVVRNFSLVQRDTSGELKVSWPAVTGADVYDLEWAYIDSSALASNRYGNPPAAALIFKNNATRVTITDNSYKIPLLYDNGGALYFRVRAVQEREHNVRMETSWSSDFGGLGSYGFNGHEGSLNWQVTTNFAEEGKRKSVVQYYDGSLRARQSVTKDNSTNTTIVGETFYDHQGRPTIQVMPAPTLSSVIKYSPGFNKGINSPEYDKGQYDTLPSPTMFLTASAQPMSTGSGASQYYSPNNPDTSGFNKFIPDAEGYAFTETSYTQDNTGRISRQGGLGPVFKLGSTHESEYYYGSPGEGDLDALFGTDAGDKSHYFKNMTRDANGQYAVTYIDMHGRTIATALAGRPDSGRLSDLSSYKEESVVDTLSRNNNNIIKDLTLENSQSQLVTIDGNYEFKYQLKAPVIKFNGCSGPICFNGLYDLQITITDDAYNQRLGGKPFDTVFHNYNLDSLKADCSIQPRDFNISFTKRLTRGNYEITKRLTINQQALEYYRDSIFMKQDTCVTLEDFIQQQRQLLANEQCVPDCRSCMDSIGTWQSFWAKYPDRIGQPVADSALYKTQALSDYNRAVEACDALCKDTSDVMDIRSAMLMDMSAPSGQYADVEDAASIYSIFYDKDNTMIPAYRRDSVYYLNEEGLPDMVYDDETQTYVKPQQLSPGQFAAKFKASWAEALLKFHPEYYKYAAYLQRRPYYDWDRKMEAIDTYDEAKKEGYLNPTANDLYPFTKKIANKDPLASRDALITTQLEQLLTSYNNEGDPAKRLSIWSMATITVKCTEAVTSCLDTYKSSAAAFNEANLCKGDLNMAWRAFRQLYLTARRNLLDVEVSNIGAPAGVPMVSSDQLLAAGKSPRFNNATTALSQNGLGYINTNKTEKELTDSINKALARSYDENCNAYVNAWMNQLAPCNYDYSSADWNGLKQKLIQVCKEGSDVDHPLGASSVKPSSGYKYRSFQQVLDEYNSAHGINNPLVCNAYLITAPAPYDKQPAYADKPSYTRPADCECNQLRTLQEEYNLHKKSSDADFASYLNRTRGTTLTQKNLQALLNACNAPAGSCDYLETPVTIPVLIQCSTAPPCVSCTEVNGAFSSFQQTFPGVEPTKEEGDSTQQLKNQLFAAYMNNQFGFSKQAWEYLVFMDTCLLHVSKDSTVCKPGREMMHTYADSAKETLVIADVVRTQDNGFMLGGTVSDKGSTVGYLLKTNAKGEILWSKQYKQGTRSLFSKVKATKDGGFIAIGAVWGAGHVNSDMSIVKTNSIGQIEWSKRVGLNTPSGETGAEIIQLSDGGYAFAGRYDIANGTADWLVGALSPNGAGRWVRHMGNNSGDEGYSMLEDHDTLVIVGCSYMVRAMNSDFDVILAKLNKNTGTLNKIYRYDLGSAPITSNNYSGFIYRTPYGYLMNVANGYDNGARNVLLGVTTNGSIIFSKQLLNPMNNVVSQWMPTILASDNSIITAQNVLSTPRNMIAFNKINADSTWAWTDLIRMDSSTSLNAMIERVDGSFAAGGTYGKNGLLVLAPLSGRLHCSDTSINGGFGIPIRNSGNTNASFSINMPRGMDTAILSLAVTATPRTVIHGTLNCTENDSCYKIRDVPLLCGNANPIFGDVIDSSNNCSDNEYFAVSKGTDLYNAYRDSVRTSFGNKYADSCMQAGLKEVYTLGYDISEYHYTLYYYDQAGNLVKTVPPAGVVVDRSASWLASVRAARAAGQELTPAHSLVTNYRYNTLNMVVAQRTPDAGISKFWYDRLGRVAVSQNSKQLPLAHYSYTQYDPLGRITEVGEISSSTAMRNTLSRRIDSLEGWFANSYGSRTQITRTNYDIAHMFLPKERLVPANLRNRVSWTALFDSSPEQDNGAYATATFYSYDIHGNVDTLLQDYKKGMMYATANEWKKLVYRYDLISGKVNHVAYQPGKPDAFYHRYSYDANNRLTNVETSTDSVYWENDAYYQYYKHGSLARTVLGQQQVQGQDYAYTLQGWLKGVNSTATTSEFDMGHDGNGVAKDVYGFALHYYGNKDYKPISSSQPFAGAGNTEFKPLFNGNIAAISQSLPSVGIPLRYTYNYDVLNRLKGMQVAKGLDSITNKWTPVDLPDFKESVSYDANGNILNYNRNGNKASVGVDGDMDQLTYHYRSGTNKLDFIHDDVGVSAYNTDIDNQEAGNYEYDNIGNLVKDSAGNISDIRWTLYGKISNIIKKDGTVIQYTYDAKGNRISKKVGDVYTWYVRDASGKVMSIYTQGDNNVHSGKLTKLESHLYGSSRLGTNSLKINLEDGLLSSDTSILGLGVGFYTKFTRGEKLYELGNHLENVLATISDKRWLYSGKLFADVVSSHEYYPFGMMMPGRGFSNIGYRYGFNGKENDNEVKGEGNQQDYGMRVYDPRIGKFLSVDPLTKQYPYLTPYQFASNTPIEAIDLDGKEKLTAFFLLDDKNNGKVLNENATAIQISYDIETKTMSALYGTVGGDAIKIEYGLDTKKMDIQFSKLYQDNIVSAYGQLGTDMPMAWVKDANALVKAARAFGGISAVESKFDEIDRMAFKIFKTNKLDFLSVDSRALLDKVLHTPEVQIQALDSKEKYTVRIFENEPIKLNGMNLKLGLIEMQVPKPKDTDSSDGRNIGERGVDFFKDAYDKLIRGIYDTEQWLKNGAPGVIKK